MLNVYVWIKIYKFIGKTYMNEIELQNEKSFRDYLLKKYLQELAVIITCLSAIIISGICKLIEPNTVGALLGVAVGYGLKGVRKLHK